MIHFASMFPRPLATGDQSMDVKFEPKLVEGLYVPSALIGLWVHFTDVKDGGGGASLDTIVVRIDSYITGETWDQCVESREKIGIAASGTVSDYVLTVTPEYAGKYVLEIDPENPNAYDRVHVTWTNADDGNVRWGVKVGIVPLTALG